MKPIPFYKAQGAGNDFIIIDNRDQVVPGENLPRFAFHVCRRKLSIGADGLILIEPSYRADFAWKFFNADGSHAEMCGNGARCVARVACEMGICKEKLVFDAGEPVEAFVKKERVSIKMGDPGDMQYPVRISLARETVVAAYVDTGVPHVVIEKGPLSDAKVYNLGKDIRNHERFSPKGTNVNFFFMDESGRVFNRTYERGVEDETLACGTGCVAVALFAAKEKGIASPVTVIPRSGVPLLVRFTKKEEHFSDIYLEGDARIIYKGMIFDDAFWEN